MKNKKNSWSKPRHIFFYGVSKFLIGIYAKLAYHYKGKKFDNKSRPYVFLYNHQTPLDQHLMYLSLPKQPYTIATEDIFNMGFLSRFIVYTQAPIPFKKSENDISAVKTCIKIVKEGHSIALSPEGNRTFTGETVHIKPSIAKLIKLLRLPVAIFILRGGYGVMPRFADKRRKGRMSGEVIKVLEYEDYKDMTNDELYELIKKYMYVDESESTFCKSKKKAEFMERAVYVCPNCLQVGTLKSKGNTVTCSNCKITATVDDTMHFNKEFPVRTIKEWTNFQNKWLDTINIEDVITPVFTEKVNLHKLLKNCGKNQILEENVSATIFADRLQIGDNTIFYKDVSAMTVCGRKKLAFYVDDITYQITSANNFCALKYVNIYYHYKNIKENGDGFLGI